MEICVCAKCRHEWARNSDKPLPKRCPNHDCRTKHWKNIQPTIGKRAGTDGNAGHDSAGTAREITRASRLGAIKELKYEPIE